MTNGMKKKSVYKKYPEKVFTFILDKQLEKKFQLKRDQNQQRDEIAVKQKNRP